LIKAEKNKTGKRLWRGQLLERMSKYKKMEKSNRERG